MDNTFDLFIEKGISSYIYGSNADTSGVRLYNARAKTRLNVKELAAKAGVSPLTITNIELGRQRISSSTIKKLSIVLEVKISYLGCYDLLTEDTFGDKFKKARMYHGHTQLEAANTIGTIMCTIKQWESNINMPSKKFTSEIEQYLSILSH